MIFAVGSQKTATVLHPSKNRYSNEHLAKEVPFKPLPNRHRLTILIDLLRQKILNPWDGLLLLLLLIPGAIIYERARGEAQ